MSPKLFPDHIISSSQQHRLGRKQLRRHDEAIQATGFVRAAILRVLIVGMFLVLAATLVKAQIYEGAYYKDLADGNRARVVDLPPPRGLIVDRNGEMLVVNLPAFRFRECDQKGEQCTVSTISKEQAINLEIAGFSQGKSLAVDSVRSYVNAEATAHLLGYVSEISPEELKKDEKLSLGDKVGRGGVEEAYEMTLRGSKGQELLEVDAVGKKLRSLSVRPPVSGEKIKLSVDLRLQKTAYAQIKGRKAAVVVTDPKNGEVLALVSSPSFDPNLFTDLALSAVEREQRINELFSDSNQPLFDRAITGTYPAGSTFKIVTATAGLESGKIDESFTINDPGILIIGPYKFPNWKFLQNGGTQGVLNVVSALKVSNDIFFYQVGGLLGVDGLSDWARRFGLASKSGIDLPGESPGTFPNKEWRDKFAREWYLGDTYHLAIGQGDLLTTPLQVNRWTSVIANGGKLCVPHVVTGNEQVIVGGSGNGCKDMGLHKKTIDLIKQGMIEACSPGGTAYPLFNFKVRDEKREGRDIQIACKTGTAEFGDPQNHTHAWLTAYAPACAEAMAGKPVCEPEIAVTVIVEGAGEGSDVAAPVVKKVLEEWFSDKNSSN